MDAPRARVAAVVARLNDKAGIDVSIIIPTLNEEENIRQALQQFDCSTGKYNIEIIISDGGSMDGTLEIIDNNSCNIIEGSSGRAAQMNRAARVANGRLLLFLHADTVLPDNWLSSLPAVKQWGFFPLRLSGAHWFLRIIERAINLRSRLTGIAGGDQALFFDRSLFEAIGGYNDIPLMEDIAICKKARRRSKAFILQYPVITSSRRWENRGILRTVLLMWLLRLGYFIGIDPKRLHRIYYPQHCNT